MKKIYSFILASFVTFSMFAQLSTEGPSGNYGNVNSSRSGEINLYSQMNPGSYGTINSQEFPDFSNCRIQNADDFIVPSEGWDIVKVEVLGTYWNGTGPSNSFIIEIYADNAGIPASVPLYSQSGLSYTESLDVFSITLSSPINLSAGHYWISIMSQMEAGIGGRWGWQWADAPQINYEFAFQDPCGIAGGAKSPTWASGSTIPGWDGRSSYDLCFALYGPTAVPVSNWSIIIGIFLIATFIVVRYRRKLA